MGSNEHIVMLPMMAHGHLIPFLALAKKIHQTTGFTITIANTPLNIQYLRSTISTTPSNSSPEYANIRLAELPFSGTDYNLPPNTQNTENLALDQIGNLFASSTSLETPFRRLLAEIIEKEGRPPLCIISDIFFGWAVDVARSVGTVNLAFSTGGAYGTVAYISLWLNLPHRNCTDSEKEEEGFRLPGFPERCRFRISQLHRFLRMADGSDLWSRFMQPQLSNSLNSFGMLCNTVEEIEPFGMELLRKYIKIPVWAIGPLLPPALLQTNSSSSNSNFHFYRQHAGKEPGISPQKCLDWLDLQNPASVLYISFGSQNTVSPSQLMALAIGLEESEKPFIWVIRPPVGFNMKGEFRAEWLPEGFAERIESRKQGLLVRNWAPQLDILSHGSTGAFLSHCGWNSVLESLSQGVPIISWPLAAEQAYNSKMLEEEIGVCVELTRGVESVIVGNEVKKVIELVMDNKGKGGEMKKKAVEIGEHLRASVIEEGEVKGSSVKAMDDFFRTILSKR